jgi:hypothetical protein
MYVRWCGGKLQQPHELTSDDRSKSLQPNLNTNMTFCKQTAALIQGLYRKTGKNNRINEDITEILQINTTYQPKLKTKLNSMALARERTIPTERPPPVGEVSANFCG